MTPQAMTPDMQGLKLRLKAMWESGDYGHFAKALEPGALDFLDRLGLKPGERLLDVACGAGQLVIPAARQGFHATGVDIAANLVRQARARAGTEHLPAQFEEGDAEDLPYPDASFDVVTSLFGAMFAPRPERVASELVRVCRPGGRIVLGNWTPEGFIGQMFKVMGQYVPPSPLMPSPMLWGHEATVRDRLNAGGGPVHMERRMYRLAFPFPPADVVDFFRTYYGPTQRSFMALEGAQQTALRGDLERLWRQHNQGNDGTTRVDSEFLEVRVTRVGA